MYICPRFEQKLEITELQTEHFNNEILSRMLIVAKTSSASIAYIKNGNLSIRSGRRELCGNAGDIFLFPKGIIYRAEWSGDPLLEFYSIHYKQPPMTSNVCGMLQKLDLSYESKKEFSEIHRLISTQKNACDGWKAVGLFCKLYSEILPNIEINEVYPKALTEAMKFIEENISEEFSVSKLAAHCFISESRLYTLFKEYLDTTPIKFKTELRCAEASRLLVDTDLKIEQIAAKCGFNSSNYFREIFREATGKSPTEFRKNGLAHGL